MTVLVRHVAKSASPERFGGCGSLRGSGGSERATPGRICDLATGTSTPDGAVPHGRPHEVRARLSHQEKAAGTAAHPQRDGVFTA